MPWWPLKASDGPTHIDMRGRRVARKLAPVGCAGNSRSWQGSETQSHSATFRQGVMLLLASQHTAVIIGMNMVLVLVVSNSKLTCHRAMVQCHGRDHSQHDDNDHTQAPPAAMLQPVTPHGPLNPHTSAWFLLQLRQGSASISA